MKTKTPPSSRLLAINSLAELAKSKRPLTDIIDEAGNRQSIENTERRLAYEIMFRVLRNYQYLDHILARFCKKPIKKLHPLVHQGLLVGLAQILLLDTIPPFAAVDETIKALKKLGLRPHLTGFVNGVLRAVIRKIGDIPHEDSLNFILNHPKWLTDRWQKKYGKDQMVQICRANNRRSTLVLSVNQAIIDTAGLLRQLSDKNISAEQGRYSENGLLLPGFKGNVGELPGFDTGDFLVMDEGAQLIPLLLSPFVEHGRYLDGCAGLGGKSCYMAQLGHDHHIQVTAVEPQNRRYTQLLENLKRLRLQEAVTPHHQSIEEFAAEKPPLFDGVLLDVPCSGTGVIGRRPDIRWNRTEKDLRAYPQTQMGILKSGSRLVRLGGVLVYATCSLEPEENMELVQHFLKSDSRFELDDCSACLPKTCHRFIDNGCLQTIPDTTIDGFFAARLRRKQ